METIRQVLAVLVVFAALGGALWLLRRNPAAGFRGLVRKKSGRLEAIERVALSPHNALHLVRFDEHVLVIAVNASGCTLLESAPWREPEPVPGSPGAEGSR
jgi:flagellar biogenesis protein FliO